MKKLVSLALMMSLILGTTIYGTYSCLSSGIAADSNIKITIGSLKLQEEGSTDWEYTGVAEKDAYNTGVDEELINQAKEKKDNEFSVVKPGDIFTKKVTVKNSGNLNERIDVKDVSSEAGNEFVGFSIVEGAVQQEVLKPGQTITFTIQAKVKQFSSDENKANEGKNLDFNKKILEISGSQINELK
jgi:hypothetical protein